MLCRRPARTCPSLPCGPRLLPRMHDCPPAVNRWATAHFVSACPPWLEPTLQRAKEHSAEGGLLGRIRKWIGLAISLLLAAGMGAAIILILRYQQQLKEWTIPGTEFRIPNIVNNLITLIKIVIPKLVPPIVRLEKR
eukprot:SAG11_NODE_12333_length_708_cov_1.763547_2_plen_136_part_01